MNEAPRSGHDAGMLEGHFFDNDGKRIDYSLKAVRVDLPTLALRWELRRLLPFAGYPIKSHRTKVCNRVATQLPMWHEMAQSVGLRLDDLMGKSEKSKRAIGAQDDADEHQHDQDLDMTSARVGRQPV